MLIDLSDGPLRRSVSTAANTSQRWDVETTLVEILAAVRCQSRPGQRQDARLYNRAAHAGDPAIEFRCCAPELGQSFKDTKKADFVAGLVLAARGADRFILDSEHARMDLPETLIAVRRLSARWPNAQMKLVEDKANGPAVITTARDWRVYRSDAGGRKSLAGSRRSANA